MFSLYEKYDLLCLPAKVYLILSVLYLLNLIINKINILHILVRIAVIFVWTLILNMFCSYGYTNVAWFLVIFPYILGLIIFLFIIKK